MGYLKGTIRVMVGADSDGRKVYKTLDELWSEYIALLRSVDEATRSDSRHCARGSAEAQRHV